MTTSKLCRSARLPPIFWEGSSQRDVALTEKKAALLRLAPIMSEGKAHEVRAASQAFYDREQQEVHRKAMRFDGSRILPDSPLPTHYPEQRRIWRAEQKELLRHGVVSARWLLSWESFLYCLPRKDEAGGGGIYVFGDAWFVESRFAWEKMGFSQSDSEICWRWLQQSGLIENSWLGTSLTPGFGVRKLVRLTRSSQDFLLQRGKPQAFGLTEVVSVDASPYAWWSVRAGYWLSVPLGLSCSSKVWLQTGLGNLQRHCSFVAPRWRRFLVGKEDCCFLFLPVRFSSHLAPLQAEELVATRLLYRLDGKELFLFAGYEPMQPEKGYWLAITDKREQFPKYESEMIRSVVYSRCVTDDGKESETRGPQWSQFVERWRQNR